LHQVLTYNFGFDVVRVEFGKIEVKVHNDREHRVDGHPENLHICASHCFRKYLMLVLVARVDGKVSGLGARGADEEMTTAQRTQDPTNENTVLIDSNISLAHLASHVSNATKRTYNINDQKAI
jgi:hypothetical protein